MSKPAVRVEQLSKQFRLGAAASRYEYRTFREAIADAVRAPFRRGAGPAPKGELLWALRDVSFEVQPGEAVGIIGHNGAGKSTLLKVLSRITEPTSGRIELRGRVASLLEVGTGFHPELTGRENVFLNGAIMGMARREIERKFDEIVAFSEMERFIDTPVKRFSSGQYLRLAFSVAAHLEPEILVVDEVLAVGDLAFQKKCMGRMEHVASEGRTVLFVSHNLPVMRQLCSRGVLLRRGQVEKVGPIDEVVDHYVQDVATEAEVEFPVRSEAPIQLLRAGVYSQDGILSSRLPVSREFWTRIEFVVREPMSANPLWMGLFRADGELVINASEIDGGLRLPDSRSPGRYVAHVRFPGGILNAGRYQYKVAIASTGGLSQDARDGTYFELYDDTELALNSGGRRSGLLLMPLKWVEEPLEGRLP